MKIKKPNLKLISNPDFYVILLNINFFYQFPDSIGTNKNKRQSKWQTDIGTKNAIHKTFEFGAKMRFFLIR